MGGMGVMIVFVVIAIVIGAKLSRKLDIEPNDDPHYDIDEEDMDQSDKEWSSPPSLFPTSYDGDEYANIEGGGVLSANYSEDDGGNEGVLNISKRDVEKIDFDLRKAVIYSAILEPKFKDF